MQQNRPFCSMQAWQLIHMTAALCCMTHNAASVTSPCLFVNAAVAWNQPSSPPDSNTPPPCTPCPRPAAATAAAALICACARRSRPAQQLQHTHRAAALHLKRLRHTAVLSSTHTLTCACGRRSPAASWLLRGCAGCAAPTAAP
jgi:hypothetical protein